MKNGFFKALCCFIAAIVLFSALFSQNCLALTKNGPVIDLTVVPTADENYIKVDIAFSENPGIGAMTFTLLYDNTTFSASPYDKRYFYEVPDTSIKKYLIVDHKADGYVSIVWSPEGDDRLYTGTGVAFRLAFKIENMIPGKHPFEIGNIQPLTRGKSLSGCFSDFEHNKFSPVVNPDFYIIGGDSSIPDTYPWKDKDTSGTGEDPETPGGEHTHNYVLHKKVVPSCTADGYSIFECSACGEKITKDTVAALGHSFDNYWTVDRAATSSVAMKLSRHCKRCNALTDIYYYSLDTVKKLGIKNEAGERVTENTEAGLKKDEGAPQVEDPETETETKTDDSSITGAEQLIDQAKEKQESKTPTGKVKHAYSFFETLYRYLIGTSEQPGIFRIIISAILKLFGR